MLQQIQSEHLSAISGGLSEHGYHNPNNIDYTSHVDVPWQDALLQIQWENIDTIECYIGDNYSNCIIVTAEWSSIDIGGDREIRTYSDGSRALFVDGEYVADIILKSASATDGSPSASFNIGKDGVGFSYEANDGITYSFDFVN